MYVLPLEWGKKSHSHKKQGEREQTNRLALYEYILVFAFLDSRRKIKHSEVNGSKNSLNFSCSCFSQYIYEGVSKSFRTGRLERELQMVQLSATRCSCIAILWVSLMSSAAIILCVTSQWVFIVVVAYFVIDSARKLLDTPSYWGRGSTEKRFFFCSSPHADRPWGPPRLLSNRYRAPGREADHSPPSGAEVGNAWNYTSIPYTSSRRGT
jgi:hypothetical protein